MSLLRNIAAGLRSLSDGAGGRELDEELGSYLEMEAAEKMRQGVSHKDALREVRLERGSLEVTREIVRSGGWESFLETCWQDLRYGTRTLRKSAGFTIVAVMTLALGIGANTAIFSVVNAVLLRPLSYKDSDQLVQLIEHDQRRGIDFDWVSFPNFHDWAEQSKAFQYISAYKFHAFTLTNVSQAEMLFGIKASANLLPMLGAEPILGRNFRSDEDQPGRDHEVILGYDTWEQSFKADPQLIGKTLTLNDEPYTVIGVMPASFNFPPTLPITSSLPSRKTAFLTPLVWPLTPTSATGTCLVSPPGSNRVPPSGRRAPTWIRLPAIWNCSIPLRIGDHSASRATARSSRRRRSPSSLDFSCSRLTRAVVACANVTISCSLARRFERGRWHCAVPWAPVDHG